MGLMTKLKLNSSNIKEWLADHDEQVRQEERAKILKENKIKKKRKGFPIRYS